jgi:hypothetical protein
VAANPNPPNQGQPIKIHPNQVNQAPQQGLSYPLAETIHPETPEVEVRAGFLGLFPNLQDVAQQSRLTDLKYKQEAAAYGGASAMALELKNLRTAREGMTHGKRMLDEAVNEDIVIGPMVDLLNGAARRLVARSENHVARYDSYAEQRIFGKE